ncbi:DUF362 domain-containing protein [Yeguia hominis]|uniref:Ferredoxin n=1 Tax=Yeguia hominis TaxID=2763662 RepID=A0A926D6H2_9FIRM|nr:DUF362 domain-containing protein [Yeguia hominis]
MERVFLSRCPSYDWETVSGQIETMFAALELERLVKPGMRVAVKPNLVMRASPDAAVTTHPVVTAAVCRWLSGRGAKVFVAESAGGMYTPALMHAIYAGCGYREAANLYGFSLNEDFSQGVLPSPDGKKCTSFPVITPLLEADLIVDIAKLKSHCMTMFSGAVKNMFGAVPGLLKPEFHCRFPDKQEFAEMLVDLCTALKPRICVMDGIVGMEGNGPSGGTPRPMQILAAAENPFALDVVCAELIGMHAKDIPMLRAGMARGVCPQDVEQIEILGEPRSALDQKSFRMPESKPSNFVSYLPKAFRPAAEKLLTPVPKIRKRACVGCGKCAESCPQHTIRMVDHKAVIDYRSCIRCYCCQEMCPKHVIAIQRLSLFDL